MCTLSLNAERVLVKLTDGVTVGCHLTWRATPKSLLLQLWAFKRLSVRGCTLSSRNKHMYKHLIVIILKCVFSINFYFPFILPSLVLYHRSFLRGVNKRI